MEPKLIIYIIFIVLWGVYKYYQKTQKAKNIQRPTVDSQPTTASSPQPNISSQQTADSRQQAEGRKQENWKSIFEKALLGEEFTAPARNRQEATVSTQQRDDDSGEFENVGLNIERLKNQQADISTVNEQAAQKSAMIPNVITEDNSPRIKTHFNLKQALIHSVILNRPYQ